MEICILGNSHIGSLKRGWDNIGKNHSDHKVTFFASPSDSLKNLSIENGKLVPASSDPYLTKNFRYVSGGLDCICPNDYDLFVVYGLYFNFTPMDFRLSSAVINSTCRDNYEGSLNFRIASMIRELSTSPIYAGHDPLSSKPLKNQTSSIVSYSDSIEITSREVCIDNLNFILQPSITVTNGCNTKLEYSKNSRSLSDRSISETDTRHMNDEFGGIYLDEFLRGLS